MADNAVEGREGETTPREVQFLRQQVHFTPALLHLLAQNSNANTANGRAALAYNTQRALYYMNGVAHGEMGRNVHNANIEYGMRVVKIILDRTNVNIKYVARNINAWLAGRGLGATTTEEKDLVWNRGLPHIPAGKHPNDYFFDPQTLTPGGIVQMLTLLETQMSAPSSQLGDKENNIFALLKALTYAIKEDVINAATTGTGLDKETLLKMLGEPLGKIGIDLKPTE